jgi:hypothetical protein
MDESFSLLASEVFYDKNKLKQIHDYKIAIKLNKSPNDEEIFGKFKNNIVDKNGIHYVDVEGEETYVIT